MAAITHGEQLLSCSASRKASPKPAKLGLAQEALTPSLAVLLDVPAGIRAIGPEAVLLGPSEKLGEQRQRPIGLVRRARQLVMQLGNVLAL